MGLLSLKQYRSQPESVYLGWSVGTLGVSILLNTQNATVLFFLVTVLGIEPWLAGAIVTGSKLYDVVTDPLMGTITDRTTSPWGRRRPYLLTGGISCGLAFALLFAAPPLPSETITLVYVTGALLLLATAYTVFNVPYLAMPAEMVEDYHERSRMMSLRVMFISIGTFIATSVTPALIGLFTEVLDFGDRLAYATLGIIYGFLIASAMVAAFFGTKGANYTERVESSLGTLDRVRMVFHNKPFLLFLGIKLTGLLALASILAAKFFFVTVVMQRSISVAAIFGLATLVGQLVTVPAWLEYSKRSGKKRIVVVSSILMILMTLTWFTSGPEESLWIYGLRGFLLGAAGCGTILGVQAMLPDVIEYDYRRSGLRREGIFAGFLSFAEKLAFTLSAFLIGGYLSYMGFLKSAPPEQQPESAVFAVFACQALLPIFMYVIKLTLLWYYDLDEAKLKAPATAAARAQT